MSPTPRGTAMVGRMLACVACVALTARALPQPSSAPPSADARAPQAAEPAKVRLVLTDGMLAEGVLISETDDAVVIRVSGVEATFPKSRLEQIIRLDPIRERYWHLRAVVRDDDTEQLLMLVEMLVRYDELDLAENELTGILSRQPDEPDALRLAKLVVELKRLRAAEAAQPETESEQDGPEGVGPRGVFPGLSDDDINIIRVYEVDLSDPPRMKIDRETIERLMEEYRGDPLIPVTPVEQDAFFRKRYDQILDIMFRLRARHLYQEVRVLEDPASMKRFREQVHKGWLINSCGTTRCHGGTEAGRLWLNARRRHSEQTVYTNFLILDRYRTDDGRPLIDYEIPEQSLVLQMGLMRDSSLAPHPVVGRPGQTDAWRPVFRSVNDRSFLQAVDWIRSMYGPPRPEYPVSFEPPIPPGYTPPTPASDEPPPR